MGSVRLRALLRMTLDFLRSGRRQVLSSALEREEMRRCSRVWIKPGVPWISRMLGARTRTNLSSNASKSMAKRQPDLQISLLNESDTSTVGVPS